MALIRPVVGWREWVLLPGLDARVKAKIDTGALTSALHAFDLRRYRRGKRRMVDFSVHPLQHDSKTTVRAEAELIEDRRIRSSSGHVSMRPVVKMEIEMLGERWTTEVTLVSRDEMGFRMLVGRRAIRRRFVVDPGRSFLGGKP